ncbi:putative amino acid transporter, transmembrane domain-containing protein [Helianthus debilis subsp. tardiflorus]
MRFASVFEFYGAVVAYVVTTSTCMSAIQRANCYRKGHDGDCEYGGNFHMLVFGVVQIFMSQIPDLHSMVLVSIVSATMSFSYSSIGLGLGFAQVIVYRCNMGSSDLQIQTEQCRLLGEPEPSKAIALGLPCFKASNLSFLLFLLYLHVYISVLITFNMPFSLPITIMGMSILHKITGKEEFINIGSKVSNYFYPQKDSILSSALGVQSG